MRYPACFKADAAGGYVVTFRDVPEAMTQGETHAEALCMAADVLASAMDFYLEDRRPVPLPSPAWPGEVLVGLPAAVAGRVSRLNAEFSD